MRKFEINKLVLDYSLFFGEFCQKNSPMVSSCCMYVCMCVARFGPIIMVFFKVYIYAESSSEKGEFVYGLIGTIKVRNNGKLKVAKPLLWLFIGFFVPKFCLQIKRSSQVKNSYYHHCIYRPKLTDVSVKCFYLKN